MVFFTQGFDFLPGVFAAAGERVQSGWFLIWRVDDFLDVWLLGGVWTLGAVLEWRASAQRLPGGESDLTQY